MNALETIFLGVIQGLTEFLPVSSSGHLVIFQHLLGFKRPELLLDCSLHLGTLLAVCAYLRSDLKQIAAALCRGDFKGPQASLFWMTVVGTLPAAFIGITFRDYIERLFASVTIVGAMLIVTGLMLALSGIFPAITGRQNRNFSGRPQVGLPAALAIGTAQGLAIVPGISRSGMTIVVGLICGLQRDLAARFSFLLSIPAIVGAVVLQFNAEAVNRVGWFALSSGFTAAALVGFGALKVLMNMVRKGHLHYFAPYCWAAGLLAISAHML